MDDSGKPTHITFTKHYDGKDYPVSGNPDADTISVKRTDKFSAKSVLKKDGKPTLTTTRHVSKDGKTLTMKTTGTEMRKGRRSITFSSSTSSSGRLRLISADGWKNCPPGS